MGARIKWVERRFDFSFPADTYPELIERLRSTPTRLEDRVGSLPHDLLVRRTGDKWSLQEHAGHLWDLEALFWGRLDDFDAGVTTLRAADMSNRKTHGANHNANTIGAILDAFRRERMRLVARVEEWEPSMFARTAQHPRLDQPMRACDSLFFQAEHDDYHLARISELIQG
jgi:uncharacterized damage-inducible protein DinB